jgi:choline/glycine/proline betaine transport protein
VIAVTVFISFVFFVTSADSGTVVLSTLSAKGGNPDEDGPKWLRVFWGAMTALVTSALLFSGSIDALKSAVVLTSLPFSLILLLMMWGLHKAFYLESQKQIAQCIRWPRSPVRGAAGGWRQRLSQAVHFPSRDEVYRFMDTTVRPAIEEVTAVFVEKGLNVVTQPDPAMTTSAWKSATVSSIRSSTRCRCAATSRRRLPGVAWVPSNSTTAATTALKCT